MIKLPINTLCAILIKQGNSTDNTNRIGKIKQHNLLGNCKEILENINNAVTENAAIKILSEPKKC